MKDCNWTPEGWEGDTWVSDCGMSFWFDSGTPSENHMIFCCKCGKPLVEQPYVEEEES